MVEKGTTRSSETAHPLIQKVLASKPPIAELIGFSVDTIESLRPRAVGSSSHPFMLIVGVVEMIVGLHLNGALNA